MTNINKIGQLKLLTKRRFLSLFITQFLGAFNDNIYKNFVLMMIAFSVTIPFSDRSFYINLAAGVFILPFILFSFIAGQLADKCDKASMVKYTKVAEVLIMTLAVPFILYESYWFLITLLFLMGVQSAFFGPMKYALLPEYLSDTELMGGNALISGGTFVAILLGMLLAGLIMMLKFPLVWFSILVMIFAGLGWLASSYLPPSEVKCPQLRINWNCFEQISEIVRLMRSNQLILLSTVAVSWFWGLGAACLTQFPQIVAQNLGGPPECVSIILGVFVFGVGVGALSCDRLLNYQTVVFWERVSACGLSLGCFVLFYFIPSDYINEQITLSVFLNSFTVLIIMLNALLVGFFGGMFVVPLYVLIQTQSQLFQRARVIAALNIFNALGMLFCALLGMVWMGLLGFSMASFFLLMGILNSGIGVYIFVINSSFRAIPNSATNVSV